MENTTQYFPSANWASISGAFSPEELREIAKEIEKKHAKFKASQAKG